MGIFRLKKSKFDSLLNTMKKILIFLVLACSIFASKSIAQCPAPATLSSNTITYFSANIVWANVVGANSYDIRCRVFGTTQWSTINNVSSTYTLLNLQSFTKYQYSVRAVCNGINGTYSAIKLFTTLMAPCNVPSALSSSNITSINATISWQNNSIGLRNIIQFRQVGNSLWSTDSTINNSFLLQNLNPQSNYEWRVLQKCATNNISAYSGIQNFTTLAPFGVCPSPTNLSTSNITSSAATIFWDNNPNAQNFEVKYRIVGTSPWSQSTSISNSFPLINLLSQNNYEVNVKSVCSSGIDTNGSTTTFATLNNNCVAALNVIASNISTNSAQINWSAGWNDDHYSLLYRKTGSNNWDSVITSGTFVYLSGLLSGVSYEYYVRTFCNTGNSITNNTATFYTIATSCGIPAGLNFNNLTHQSANIYWTPLSGALSYELRYRIFGTTAWITVSTNSTNYLLSGLLPFTKYQYSVRALCSGLTGSYSAIKLFTTLVAPCLSPSNIIASNVTENSTQINWTAQSSGLGYRLQYRLSGSSTWITDSTTNSFFVISNLLGNSNYEFRILQKCNATLNSNYSGIISFQTLPPSCPTIIGLTATNISFQSAEVSWNTAPSSMGYYLYYKKTAEINFDSVSTVNNNIQLNNLSPQTDYQLKVRNICLLGNDTGSSTITISTLPNPCLSVTDISISNIGSSSAQISWDANPNSIAYSFLLRKSGFPNWDTTHTTNNFISLGSLLPISAYEFSIINHCSLGLPVNSSIQNFTTLDTLEVLVNTNSSWSYLDNGLNQGTLWSASNFNDLSWAVGNAELGYGDGGESTVVSFGPTSTAKYITTYFRKNFSVNHLSAYTGLKLKIMRDDGIVVYINGTEVLRNNMPSGTIIYSTLASAAINGADESAFNFYNIPLTSLTNGINTIAVEIHQNAANSSDISFDLSLIASTVPPIPAITIGPYIQMVNENSAVIFWETDLASASKIFYGTQLGQLNNSVTDTNKVLKHQIQINGLSSFTKYFYGVSNGIYNLQAGEDNHFFTALPEGNNQAFRVWITGDFGNGSSNQDLVRTSFVNYTASNPAHLWIWLGDNAYGSGLVSEYTANVFGKYPGQLKKIPVFPAVGNHDYANVGYLSASTLGTNFPYFNYFKTPTLGECGGVCSNTEKYYSYNYGNVHFISLDSYGASTVVGGTMYNWLLADLQANQQKWIVCYWHHPPYSMGTHNSDSETEMINMRQNIVPLLESFNVDLVLNGHSHTYERSFGIHGHYGLESTFNNSMITLAGTGFPAFNKENGNIGTVYAVCGVSGQGGTVGVQGSWPHAIMYTSENTKLGSMIMDVEGDSLKLKFLNSTGVISDRFNFYKPDGFRTSIKESLLEQIEDISVSPNPSQGEFTIRLAQSTQLISSVRILSVDGKVLKELGNRGSIQKDFFIVPTGEILPGIYYIEVISNEKTLTKKIIITE